MSSTENLFATRFKSARLLNGFSLQDLADVLDANGHPLTKQSLHRYEKSEVIPDSEITGWLSDALNVRPDFFARTTSIEIGEVEYRKLKSLASKEDDRIIEQTREYLGRYLELEEILALPVNFKDPLPNFKIVKEYKDVNDAAIKLREKWNLGDDPIYNIVELLEDKHIKVVPLDADMGFDGLQTTVNKTIPVVAYNSRKIVKPDRIRFTLLHELGHLLLKFDEALTSKQIENLCHQFAGAMLLPEKAIIQELGKHRTRLYMQELGHIKTQYGISMQAIVMRAKVCGIINEHYSKQFFFIMNNNGWKVDEPVDYTGEEKSNRFDQLLLRALAEEQISMSKAAALKNQKLADFKKDFLMAF
ncbi:helix-turn-helix domain-containing protein [Niabella hirudinis]|uniref:helix-turn-helix domain-containing protein n=1 Tax=Niabella hirudinis TaxID=1285929 RepID=UPI003EBCFF77